MLDQLIALVKESLNNQFLTGGTFLMVLGALGMYLRSVPSQLWNWFLFSFTVVVDIQSDQPVYDWVLMWLDTHAYGKRTRRVSVRNIRTPQGDSKVVFVPSKGNHWFFYKDRPLWLYRYTDKDAAPGSQAAQDIGFAAMMQQKETIAIRIVGRSRNLINDLINEAEKAFTYLSSDLLSIHTKGYAGWHKFYKPKRSIESIFLPPEAEASLIPDMQKFLASQEWYKSMGIPYRRGYLFYGPPGTGKSSSVEAIASLLNLPIYILNLAVVSDTGLENAILQISKENPHAILLIEDIDTTALDRKRKKNEQDISLGTLLNSLDGITAGTGIILIMTTNHVGSLDSALLRKGRVDVSIKFDYASDQQINAAVKRFLPYITDLQTTEISKWPRPITMADIQERLKIMSLGN